MKNSVIILLLLCFNSGFTQETPLSFSLQEAITYALEHNRSSKNASQDIEAARKQKWETIASGLPQINGNIDYQNFFKQQVQVIPSDFSNPNSELVPVIFGTTQNVNASATLSQLIFDGSYLVGLQSVKVFLEISEFAKVKTDLEVRKAIINAYGNVLLAEESVQILERNLTVLEKNLNDISKLYDNGFEEEESMEQLQITLSSVKSNLSNTQRLKDLAYQMLNINLGLDLDSAITLSDTLETLATTNMQLNLLDAGNDVQNTVDYKIAENDKASKQLLVKLEQSRALPVFTAFLTGGYNSFSNDFTFLDNEQDYFGYSVLGASLQIPIFGSGLKSARMQRAKINLDISENNLSETEQRLKLQIASAKSDFKFAIEDFDNKQQNLNLAERIEQKNQTKFFEGVGSSFELRQAQTQLYGAQQELLQAMLDVINSKAELETVLNSPINN